MNNEHFYIKVTDGTNRSLHFGPYKKAEWNQAITLQEFQSGLLSGYRAEVVDEPTKDSQPKQIGRTFGTKKRRKFPSTNWGRKNPLVEFDDGRSRWVLDNGEYVLIRLVGRTREWTPTPYISRAAATELAKIHLKLTKAVTEFVR